MTYMDVIEDIKKLIGIELKSVRPGANIIIQEVSEERGCLTLVNSQGQVKSRPLSELQIIWNEMMKAPAVHVEGVLHGSGTSRNQPETILANLPYVEWLKIHNKKHIAYVFKSTHPYGTLKQMDGIAADSLIAKIEPVVSPLTTKIVLVTSDTAKAISRLQDCIPGFLSTIESGVYEYVSNGVEILVLLSSKTTLPVGHYSVIETATISELPKVELLGDVYSIVNAGDMKALIHNEEGNGVKSIKNYLYESNVSSDSEILKVASGPVHFNLRNER